MLGGQWDGELLWKRDDLYKVKIIWKISILIGWEQWSSNVIRCNNISKGYKYTTSWLQLVMILKRVQTFENWKGQFDIDFFLESTRKDNILSLWKLLKSTHAEGLKRENLIQEEKDTNIRTLNWFIR